MGIKASTEIHFSIFLIESFNQPTRPHVALRKYCSAVANGKASSAVGAKRYMADKGSMDLGLSYSYTGITLQGVFYQRGRFG